MGLSRRNSCAFHFSRTPSYFLWLSLARLLWLSNGCALIQQSWITERPQQNPSHASRYLPCLLGIRNCVIRLGRYFFWVFFSFFGPLVPWSSNPLVPWSSRPPSSRPLIVWSLVPWSSGPLVLWSPGPLVPCSSGLLVSWSSVLFRSFFSNLSFTLFYYQFYIFTLSCVC